MKEVINPHTIGITYFENSDIHLRYGSIFWGGDNEGKGIFLLHKRVMQNIRGVGKQTFCRQIFRNLNMLPVVGIT
jgi:hypothetical protein